MIRNLVCISLLLLSISSTAWAQYDPHYKSKTDESRRELYSRKFQSYTKMKKTGIGLGLAGGVLTVAGALMISSADWETTTSNGSTNVTTDDSEGAAGLAMVIIGVPLSVTGTVLGLIGGAKANSYRRKLEGLSVNVNYGQNHRGLALVYRF